MMPVMFKNLGHTRLKGAWFDFMRNRIKAKLRSRTGASITFALLLFLVCTVLCSVIIAAATAASGRMSRIAEMDQRYYAVTSAAEMLKQLFDGKSAVIEKKIAGTRTETYQSGLVSSSTTYDDNDFELYVDSDEVGTSPSFDSILSDAAYRYFQMNQPSALPVERTFNIQSSDDIIGALNIDAENDPLAVAVSESVDEDGNILITVGNDYKLVLLFSASVTGPAVSEEAGDSKVTADSETEYTVTSDMIKTETTTLTWTLTGMKASD